MQEVQLISRGVVKTFKGPSTWGELTKSQFMAAIAAKNRINDNFKQAIVLTQILFSIPLTLIKQLTTVQAYQLAGVMNFLFLEKAEIKAWHLSVIKIKNGDDLFGPSDTLGNICFGELMFADLSLKKYKETKAELHLENLVAILFRPGGDAQFELTGDKREPFNKSLVDIRRKRNFEKITQVQKQAVLINYIGCRELMSKSFKHVFPQAEPEAEPVKSTETWLDVAIQLARKENALGTIKDVEITNAWLVLKVLDKVIMESKEMQAEMNKLK